MKLRSLVLSALLALGIAPMANAAEEVIPTVSSFDFLVDNSGSMLTSPLLNARSKMDLAKDVMARVNAQIPNLPYQGSVHLFSPDGTPQPFGNWDRAGMAQAIGRISTGGEVVGRMTNMASGLSDMTQEYAGMQKPAAAIIVSDGMANRGGDPVAAARAVYDSVPGLCFHVISMADKPEGQAVLDQIAALNPCSVSVKGADLLASDAAVKDFVERVFYGVVEEEVVILRGVNFAFDSAALNDKAKGILDEVAEVIKGKSSVKLVLEGWTDTTGPESYNMGLSQRRADSVKAYLEQKGIPASEMRAVGEGESTKYENGTAEGRYLNRRVELIFE